MFGWMDGWMEFTQSLADRDVVSEHPRGGSVVVRLRCRCRRRRLLRTLQASSSSSLV